MTKGIILAAGKGRRLESVLPGKPKCLIDFGGKSLIRHQIAALIAADIREVVVVVGYQHHLIREHLADMPCAIHYIENPIYDRTNTLYSLWLAREFFDDPFIYFNADVLCDYRIVKRLCEEAEGNNLACVKGACGDEEVKVRTEASGRIVEIGKHILRDRCYGEFIGIARFAKKDNGRFSRILDECILDETTWNYFFEHAVNRLAGEAVLQAVDISDLPATEIDFPEDLEYAKKQIFPRLAAMKGSGYRRSSSSEEKE